MPEDHEEEQTWMPDTDEGDRPSISEYNIATNANDFNSTTIASYMESAVIKLPLFQRLFVWDRPRASRLIESLVLGLPVPQIFLYERSKNNFIILDGQQRLLSIYFFIKKRFPKKNAIGMIREKFLNEGTLKADILANDDLFENFNLKLSKTQDGKENKFNTLNHDTLAESKLSFDLRPIRCITLKQNEPRDDDSSMYEIFDRLNTGGMNLMPQEIRANLYYSNFYKELYEWNKLPAWRSLLGQPKEDIRMRDVELLLRVFALLIDGEKYKPSMASFLNEFSRYARKFEAHTIKLYSDIFNLFFEANPSLSRDALRKGSRLSIAVFESLFIYACLPTLESNGKTKPLQINASSLHLLAEDNQFKKHLQEGTTKTDNVKGRIRRAKEILSGAG
jgi:Protein of unknown function DUF262